MVFLCQNNLSNKYGRCPKCKEASFKKFGNFPGFEKSISSVYNDLLKFIRSNFIISKTTHFEITNITMIKIVMLVCNFVLGCVVVVALFC